MHMRDYAQDAMAMVEGETRADLGTDNKLRLALTFVFHGVDAVGVDYEEYH